MLEPVLRTGILKMQKFPKSPSTWQRQRVGRETSKHARFFCSPAPWLQRCRSRGNNLLQQVEVTQLPNPSSRTHLAEGLALPLILSWAATSKPLQLNASLSHWKYKGRARTSFTQG